MADGLTDTVIQSVSLFSPALFFGVVLFAISVTWFLHLLRSKSFERNLITFFNIFLAGLIVCAMLLWGSDKEQQEQELIIICEQQATDNPQKSTLICKPQITNQK